MTKFKLNTDSWGYFLVNEIFYIRDKKSIVQNTITFTNQYNTKAPNGAFLST